MVNPASRQMSTNLVASSAPLVPNALKNSFPPPNVPVPKVRTGTLKPEPPKNLYSMRGTYRFLCGLQAGVTYGGGLYGLRACPAGLQNSAQGFNPGNPQNKRLALKGARDAGTK